VNFGAFSQLAGPLAGGMINPMSGIGMAGGPLSGTGLISDMLAKDKKKKEGIASMLSGIGKGHDKNTPDVQMAQQPGFDIQGLLSSLFGQ
jgi:hypothetical protein